MRVKRITVILCFVPRMRAYLISFNKLKKKTLLNLTPIGDTCVFIPWGEKKVFTVILIRWLGVNKRIEFVLQHNQHFPINQFLKLTELANSATADICI